jgi:5-methylcytosine-specific restriction protein A
MSVIFKGASITAQDILAAMSDFDSQYPDTNDYDSWLDKETYKYAVRHNNKLYPCKHILSQATGIGTSGFSGGKQTNNVFRKLGFHIIDKP